MCTNTRKSFRVIPLIEIPLSRKVVNYDFLPVLGNVTEVKHRTIKYNGTSETYILNGKLNIVPYK